MASAAVFMSFTKLLNSSFSWDNSRLCMRPAGDPLLAELPELGEYFAASAASCCVAF